MNKTSQILRFLKQCSGSTRLLNQILSRITITGIGRTETLIWNSIIRAFAKSPNPIQAIFTYNHFIAAGSLDADEHTYPAVLKACGCLPSLPKTKEIHARVVKIGFAHDVCIQNCLIYIYGVTFSQIVDACKLFDEMPERDLTSWNSILTAYVSAPELLVRAWILFREMVCRNVRGDEVSLAILLSGCKHGELRFGKIIHAYASKVGLVFFTKVGNAIMDVYATMCEIDATQQLFDEMEALGSSDVASDTIMINAYTRAGSVDLAREVFDRTCSRDVVLWNSMLHGYVKAKRADEALHLFERMEIEAVNPDENTMVSVISACASLADLQSGRLLHRFIRRRGVREDEFVQTALVDMYAKCGSRDDSLLTFLKMKHKDVFAWTAVISGFAEHGDESLKLLSMMQKAGVRPNEATLVAMLKACSNSGLVEEGLQLFTKMAEDEESEIKEEHLGCVVDLLSKAGMLCEAEELIERAKVEDKGIAWKTLMGGCSSYGDVCIGERVAEELKRVSGERRHRVSVLLSNFYAFGRRWSDVEEVRRMGRRLEGKKEPGISCVQAITL